MTDKIEDLIGRLEGPFAQAWTAQMDDDDNLYHPLMLEAADALRTQRDDVIEECARVADFHDTVPHIPGACGAAIRDLKRKDAEHGH